MEKFNGNLTLAIAAYNSGPKTVERYGRSAYLETKQYVNRVLSLYNGKRQYALAVAAPLEAADNQVRPDPIYNRCSFLKTAQYYLQIPRLKEKAI